MSKKNKHIDKYLTDNLPEPDISADDAWADMDGMLNSAASSAPKGKPGFKALKWPLTAFTGVAVTAGLIWKLAAPFSADSPTTNKIHTPTEIADTTGKTIGSTPQQSSLPSENTEHAAATSPDINPVNPAEKQAEIASKTILNPTSAAESPKSTNIKDTSGELNTYSAENLKNSFNQQPQANRRARFVNRESQATHKRDANAKSQSLNTIEDQAISESRFSKTTPRAGQNSGQGNNRRQIRPSDLNAIVHSDIPTNAENRVTRLEINHFPESRSYILPQAPELGSRIKVTGSVQKPAEKMRSFHVGLEWQLTTPFRKTDFLFTARDSADKPALLLIPALVVAKSWNSHQLTATIAARQSYFGNGKMVAQEADSSVGGPRAYYHNTNFIKATGLNISMQYYFRFAGPFSVGAGASYSLFSNALARESTTNWALEVREGSLLPLNDTRALKRYIKPHQLALKSGLLFSPGRFQAGFNIILPLSDISKEPGFKVKEPNAQVFLRWLVW